MALTTMTLGVSTHHRNIVHIDIQLTNVRGGNGTYDPVENEKKPQDTTQYSARLPTFTGIQLTPKPESTLVGEAGGFEFKMLASG